MVDMNEIRGALDEAAHGYGLECNCDQGDGCQGDCTRSRVEQAIAAIDSLTKYCFHIKHVKTGMVSVVTFPAPNMPFAIAQAFALFGDDMSVEGFRCYPVKE